ncbi:MAG: DUF4901 domain-containing protein, partial [Bacillus amyloliquefaciens]
MINSIVMKTDRLIILVLYKRVLVIINLFGRKGSVMMKKEELKQLALRIGNVPARYESNVEEYQEDEVLFWWEDKNDPEAGIMVELDRDGKLKYLSR